MEKAHVVIYGIGNTGSLFQTFGLNTDPDASLVTYVKNEYGEWEYDSSEDFPLSDIIETYDYSAPGSIMPFGSNSGTDIVKLYYHHDRLGSTDYLTNNVDGRIMSYISRDDWGQPDVKKMVLNTGTRELGDLVLQYTVHPYDLVLGAYFAQARMYDAADRRFMAMDILLGNAGNPSSIIRYNYCFNNPIMHSDPYGLFVLSKGSQDKEMVTILQKYLSELGYLYRNPGDPFGNYYDKTVEAVALFGRDRNGTLLSSVSTNTLLLIVNAGINRKYNLEGFSKFGGGNPSEVKQAYDAAAAEYAAISAQIITHANEVSSARAPSPYLKPFDPCYWSGKPTKASNLDRARIEVENMSELRARYGDLIKQWADKLNCSPGALAGVIFAESSLRGFVNGQVLIRFEVHTFRNKAENHRFELRNNEYISTNFRHSSIKETTGHQFRSTTDMAWQDVHEPTSKNEQVAFAVASGIDRSAALQSISYGFGQIMGFNYKDAGFESTEHMMSEMSSGQTAQINAMCQFISNYKLTSNSGTTMLQALQQENWPIFVMLYNGKATSNPENGIYVKSILVGKSAYERNATRI